MKKANAKLRRRPLLTPVWLSGIAAIIVVSFMVWLWGTADSTTVVVIRHAEKSMDAGDDPPLSPAGQARADRLARMLGDDPAFGRIDAIYATSPKRIQMTAAPLAARLKLSVTNAPADVKTLVRQVLRTHAGGRILVIGHSNTVGPIVAALSGWHDIPPIGEDDFGTMYIVSVPRLGHANVLKLRY
jgi:broad specificity phosphatase PhoE